MYHYSIKKKRRINKRVIIFIISLFVLVGAAYVLFLSPVFEIKEIIISGNKKVSSEEIGSNLNCDNIFLTTNKSVKGQLLKRIPGILDLKIKRKFFQNEIEIIIQEREIVGILCNEKPAFAEATAGKCFYFDKDGVIFESAPNTSGSLITLVKDYSQNDFKLGESILDKNFIDTVLTIKEDLFQKIGLKVASFDIESYPMEKLRVVTSESWYILFSLQRDIKSQLLALKVALDEKIQNRMSLEYVDLRIENRIYYK